MKMFVAMFLAFIVSGCATTTQLVDTRNDTSGTVMGLEYRDFEKAAGEAI